MMTCDIETRVLLALLGMTANAQAMGEPPRSCEYVGRARIAAAQRHAEAVNAMAGWHAAPRMGVCDRTTRRALQRLQERGLVASSGATRGKRWRLTEAGQAAAVAIGRAVQQEGARP